MDEGRWTMDDEKLPSSFVPRLASFVPLPSSPTTHPSSPVAPLCPVFGVCGGCSHQDIPYEEELRGKEEIVREILQRKLALDGSRLQPIVPSPKPYHYRSRIDVALLRTREGKIVVGFSSEKNPKSEIRNPKQFRNSKFEFPSDFDIRASKLKVIPIESCAIAMPELSRFIPELRERASAALPAGYRTASLVVKTGDDGRVVWGGIGRRSLEQKEADYLWTDIAGTRVFYSLGTFFQANLSILPALVEKVAELGEIDAETAFFDLYSGVGLFGVTLASRAKFVVMIEDSPASITVARHNVRYHGLKNVEIHEGHVEDKLPEVLSTKSEIRNPKQFRNSKFEFPSDFDIRNSDLKAQRNVVLVDPPRKGLSAPALEAIARSEAAVILYLSCNPDSLARDLWAFKRLGWETDRAVPFDLFPKTRHIETLARLVRVKA